MKHMKAYIYGDNSRTLAFAAYKRAHRLQGQTVQYAHFFDFIHGGGVEHPTVKAPHETPRKPVATYDDLNKNAPPPQVFKPVQPLGPLVNV
jgi:hypothetical protein